MRRSPGDAAYPLALLTHPLPRHCFATVTAEHLAAVAPWSVPTLTSLVIVAVGLVNLLGLRPAARLQSFVTLVRVVALSLGVVALGMVAYRRPRVGG